MLLRIFVESSLVHYWTYCARHTVSSFTGFSTGSSHSARLIFVSQLPEIAWNSRVEIRLSLSLSLSTDFYIYVKSHSQFLVDLRQLYRLINFEKKGKYWKSLDRYQRDLSFDHPRRGRKSRNDVDKWICRKRVFDAEDDTKVERS